MSISNFG